MISPFLPKFNVNSNLQDLSFGHIIFALAKFIHFRSKLKKKCRWDSRTFLSPTRTTYHLELIPQLPRPNFSCATAITKKSWMVASYLRKTILPVSDSAVKNRPSDMVATPDGPLSLKLAPVKQPLILNCLT